MFCMVTLSMMTFQPFVPIKMFLEDQVYFKYFKMISGVNQCLIPIHTNRTGHLPSLLLGTEKVIFFLFISFFFSLFLYLSFLSLSLLFPFLLFLSSLPLLFLSLDSISSRERTSCHPFPSSNTITSRRFFRLPLFSSSIVSRECHSACWEAGSQTHSQFYSCTPSLSFNLLLFFLSRLSSLSLVSLL